MSKKVKIPKMFWAKGKSKFLSFREELKMKHDFVDNFSKEEQEKIIRNRLRRAGKKINQPKHPESYYHDTDVYTNKKNRFFRPKHANQN